MIVNDIQVKYQGDPVMYFTFDAICWDEVTELYVSYTNGYFLIEF